MYLAIRIKYSLGLVFKRRNGEVLLQNRERIHQQLILAIDFLLDLLLGTILLTKEARTFCDGLLVDLGTCGYHTSRVPLNLNAISPHHQLTRLGASQVMITLSGYLPLLQLTVKETLQRRVCHQFLLTLKHLLTCCNLKCAQAIFIEVVGIDLVDAKGRITVSSPTATQIELSIDTSDTIMT